MLNFKYILPTILVSIQVIIGSEKKECVTFSTSVPAFNKTEKEIIQNYFPILIAKYPVRLVGKYLNEITVTDSAYTFLFLALVHLRSHKCGDFETIVSDGTLNLRVNKTTKDIYVEE